MHQKTILLADSGSTKTDWAILQPGRKLISFQSTGINPFYQKSEEIVPVLESQVLPNIHSKIDGIFFYGAGCADEKTSQPVKDALLQCFKNLGALEVASDMLGAARGLCGHQPGFACILGTGSNNAFYDGEKNVRSIGSLGFWLGDEGSGSYIGKMLVVSYLQNELPSDLHGFFKRQYPEIERLYVLETAYKKPYPNRFFASFSKFVGEHIRHEYLQNLVAQAFSLFLEKYVLKHANAFEHPVHFTGSVAFHYQDILKKVVISKGLTPGNILKSPLEGLVQYYSSR